MLQQIKSKRVPVPIRPPNGLNLDNPAPAIDDKESTNIRNFRFYEGRMRKRFGFKPKGQNVTDPLMHLDTFGKADGSEFSLALTTKKLFQFNGGLDEWVEIPRVTTPTDFLGSDADSFSGRVIQDNYVFSQGVDPLMKWNGVLGTYSVIDAANAPPARYITSFAGRALLGFTVEGGAEVPTMVRWCARNNINDWTGPGAGFQNLNETPDKVMGLDVLANSVCVVYKERTIIQMIETGQLALPFGFNSHVLEDGPYVARSITNLRGSNSSFFVGHDDIFIYNLANLNRIGKNIRRSLINSIDPTQIDKCFSRFVEEYDEVWTFVVSVGSSYPDLAWVYNFLTGQWHWFEFSFATQNWVRSAGYLKTTASITYDDAVGTYDEQTLAYNSRALGGDAPTNSLGTQAGQVYELDQQAATDDGELIRAVWESKEFDLGAPDMNKTFTRLKINYYAATPTSVLCAISLDGGNTWLDEKGVVLLPGPTDKESTAFYDTVQTGPRPRFRIKHELDGFVDIVGFLAYLVPKGEVVVA